MWTNHWICLCFERCELYFENRNFIKARCRSMQCNAAHCRRIQLNAARYSSIQFEKCLNMLMFWPVRTLRWKIWKSLQLDELNAMQCGSLQTNASQYSSIQFNPISKIFESAYVRNAMHCSSLQTNCTLGRFFNHPSANVNSLCEAIWRPLGRNCEHEHGFLSICERPYWGYVDHRLSSLRIRSFSCFHKSWFLTFPSNL